MFLNRSLTFFSIVGAACLSMQLNAQTINMRDAIAETLQSNPEVQAELREVDARERQIREALGGYYPSVDLLAGFGFQERDPTSRQFSDPDRTRNELERHEAQLSVKQLVFDGFNTPNEHKNQIARHESAEYRAYSVGENIALEVVRSYLEVIKQQDILVLAKQTLATHEDIYDKMKKRADSGVGSTADFDQISGRLALAKTNVINQTANLLDAKTNFQRVVGRYPQEGELAVPGTYSKYLPATSIAQVSRIRCQSCKLSVRTDKKHLLSPVPCGA